MKHFFQKQSQFSLHSPQQKNNQPIEAYYNLIQDKGENSPSFHFENAKNNFRNSSLIDEECCQTDGYSTFYKTEQSNQFTNTNDGWFKKIPKAENALKLKGLDHKSNNSTPHCIRPKAISLTSQTSSFLNRIQDPQVQRKQSVQVFTTRNSTFGHSQQQKIEHPQPTASDQIQNKKTQRKKKQEKIYKQTERVLKEIEVRKHTFTTFGFKAQEKSEDPLLQYTINKMLNSNRPKGSMFVTDLWPESNVKQFISYQKMGQGKYIMRKIAQQAFKKDEEGVYYFFKDNAPNDNRQQKQIQTVFQSKDSKYEKLIKKFVPQEQGEYQLNSNVYKYDPNACSEIVEQIYQQNYQDKKLENQYSLSLKNQQSLGGDEKILDQNDTKRKLSQKGQLSPQIKRQSMINYANKFKFQKINKKYLFFSKEEYDEKLALKNMIIDKIKNQIDTESNRIDDLSQINKKKQDLDSNNNNNYLGIKTNKNKIQFSNKLNNIFESIHEFQVNKKNLSEKKEIENLSRQLNYAVFKSVEQNLLHKDDNETWGDKQYSESS
ncbi:hypothetical protein TTHERM_00678070 (macronuclear) [Tetrahymena thermophila SB210]|uniref:Uncharacterized protein n=1 Tax=Tetrahymena thermophila (strain SB210) TaxID=312017 RepID=I7MB35_TETTS|nr:hypothetical protein TTHERM_00678070 [Tetrahymena thermophila SB210]EAS07541.2 hypothetical protein TTHERM_00678070 [Tetrahymena thermophila SB210]|eukprot:XP_001027783.2 hypothetical protein TTHERM_00678070 [Tetrahymena thermophila SB210]